MAPAFNNALASVETLYHARIQYRLLPEVSGLGVSGYDELSIRNKKAHRKTGEPIVIYIK